MRDVKGTTLPVAFSEARVRFEQWRSGKRPRSRIPEELWTLAVGLAREHGVNRTSRALRLDYYTLKRRLEASSDAEKKVGDFLEVFPFEMVSDGSEWTMELESGTGVQMRMRVKGSDLPDLAALVYAFRSKGS
jgi:hypothetical protein